MCKEKRCLSAGGGYGGTEATISSGAGETGTTNTCHCPQCPSATTMYPVIDPRDPIGRYFIFIAFVLYERQTC